MEKFYLGLDIGTNSVGIACTDENYRLLRSCGKDCWAVRLYDEAQTGVERRMAKTARRRLARRKQRLKFLQALFAEILEDKTFFIRLNNSQFLPEDKDESLRFNVNNLFADEGFTDKDFHKKYPTIYHLRRALMTEVVTDIRLYYLALHHIVKYRGHFLFEGSMADIRDIRKLFVDLDNVCRDVFDEDVPVFDVSKSDEAKKCLLSNDRDKTNKLEELFGFNDKRGKELIKAMCGYTVKPSALFGDKYKEEKSFAFRNMTDETFEGLQAVFGDDFSMLAAIKGIYDYITFEKILEGQPDISSAMIALYDKHKTDLKKLKDFIHNNSTQEEYNRFFKSTTEKANYANYVGYTCKGGDKKKVKRCKDSDFYAYLKKFVAAIDAGNDEEVKNEILSELEEETFLPKILHADNGLFPHQVNEDELNKIVANMVRNCPQTVEIADKILPIFLFRLPYYVGPLTGKNSWVVRGREKITPWNFKEVVDLAQSNEAFMRRMTNKCSYLHGEDVLPKASIYYQKFNVLNQINKLKVNDRAISVATKQKIYTELFLTRKKVTDASIKDLFVRLGLITESEKKQIELSGKDGELNASMSSYIQLKTILGEFVDDDLGKNGGVCENIILWHTLNTDKKIVEELIIKNYGDIPEISANIKALKGLVFKDFGRLSKKFLTELRVADEETGELYSILDLLYETNQNLNEILFNEKYGFSELIKEQNGNSDEKIDLEDVEELYVSPAVRRGIWQSLKMVDEYVEKLGKVPDKIFVEVTREDGKKGDDGRTVSRQKQLLEKYKGVEGIDDLAAELKEKNDLQLRQERLYLYFRQLGRCMYSGERIDLELLNTNQYDVDHILPRTYIKDDSLDNKALVLRAKNADKADLYPVPQSIVTDVARRHWEVLKAKGLMSALTYARLTRTEPLGDDDYQYFINRQKTITDQTVKAVAELLARKYPKTKIVYSKAKNVSEFRNKFDLFKCRETNDLHHARDAYLNVVVGNVFDTCFSAPFAPYRKDGDKWRMYNLKTMFARDVNGAWVQDGDTSINIVKKTYAKPSMAVTRYAYCNKGGFYDQTVYDKQDASITAPRKENGPLKDFTKYGGYKSQKTAYFAIVQSKGKKGNIVRTIEAVPVMIAYQSKNDAERLHKYFETYLEEPVVIVPKVKIKQLVKYNGTYCYMAGVTGNSIILHNAVELFTDNKTDEYVRELMKLVDSAKKGRVDTKLDEYVMKTNRNGVAELKINKERNLEIFDLLLEKLESTRYRGVRAAVTFYNTVLKGRENFEKLWVCDQAAVLLQILRFFKCNAELSDLSLIDGPRFTGVLTVNKDFTDADFRIVHRSPCALTEWEQKI